MIRHTSALRSLRESRGLTITELARRVGIGVSRLQMIEVGQRPAAPDIADAIARELGADRTSIFAPGSFTVRQGQVSSEASAS